MNRVQAEFQLRTKSGENAMVIASEDEGGDDERDAGRGAMVVENEDEEEPFSRRSSGRPSRGPRMSYAEVSSEEGESGSEDESSKVSGQS
jgi:hypothetical protein